MVKPKSNATLSGYVLSLLRIVAGGLFVCHGLQLTFGMFGGHRLAITTFLGFGGVLQLLGGALLVLGLFTRATAFILSGEMAVAYFRFHAPHGLLPLQNQGELAALYCFLFLYFVFAGAGPVSLDRVARGRN